MKHTLLLIAAALLFGIQTYAQTGVAINTTGDDPDNSAILDVSSTEKGILIPRMTQADRIAIITPATGLLVYQNDGTVGFYYFGGSVWRNLSLVNFSESNFTYDSKTGVKFTPNNSATNVDLILQPKGTGSILAHQPDGTFAGGNNRGNGAIDLQSRRLNATEVASGNYSVLIGGSRNIASGENSIVTGGNLNNASGSFSTICGGIGNDASGESSFIAGGASNNAVGNYSFIGGYSNSAPSFGETILGYYSTTYTPGSNGATQQNQTDRLFSIGNGASWISKSNALTILKNANTTIGGSLTINGNGTNTSYLFPETRGTSGQVLQTNGSGTLSWATPTAGTVTGVTGTAPIVSSGGTTPAISISAATTSAAGSMSAADKTKLNAITGTNTGDQTITLTGDVTGSGTGSFAATISSASVTNPKMATMNQNSIKANATGSSASPSDFPINANTFPSRKSTGNLTANTISDFAFTILDDADATAVRTTIGAGTGNGTVTGVTGTAPIVSSGGTTPAISISAATTSAAGSMSAADKTKLDAQTTGTATGQMQYWNGTAWITVASGGQGQILRFIDGIPTWVNDDLINSMDIGDFYQGGIIAYFLQPGDPGYDASVRHGLIAAPSNQSSSTTWGCVAYDLLGADGTELGTGYQNTRDIVAGCDEAGIAARICNDLELNGYSDWYLPSRDELFNLYLNRTAIGGFDLDSYWSSSEANNQTAWCVAFNGGLLYGWYKHTSNQSVRAVRAF